MFFRVNYKYVSISVIFIQPLSSRRIIGFLSLRIQLYMLAKKGIGRASIINFLILWIGIKNAAVICL